MCIFKIIISAINETLVFKSLLFQSLRNNGSIYLHVYITLHGYSPDPSTGRRYAGNLMSYNYKQLNKYKRQKFMKTHNLLTGETALTPEQLRIAENVKGEIISHWHPNLTVNLVTDHTSWVQGSLPPPLEERQCHNFLIACFVYFMLIRYSIYYRYCFSPRW